MRSRILLLAFCLAMTLVAEQPKQKEEVSPEQDPVALRLGGEDPLTVLSIGPSVHFLAEHTKTDFSPLSGEGNFSLTTDTRATYLGINLGAFNFLSSSPIHIAQTLFLGSGVGGVKTDASFSLPDQKVSRKTSPNTNFIVLYELMLGYSFYLSDWNAFNISLGLDYFLLVVEENQDVDVTVSFGIPVQLSLGTHVGNGLWLAGGVSASLNPIVITSGASGIDTSAWDVRKKEHYYLSLSFFIRLGALFKSASVF